MALEKILAAFVGSAALFSSGFLKGAFASPAANPQPASAPATADQVEEKDLELCVVRCVRDALFMDDDSRGVQRICVPFCRGDLEFAIGDRVQLELTPAEVHSPDKWSRTGTVLGVDEYEGRRYFKVMLDRSRFPRTFHRDRLEKLEIPECELKPGADEAEPEAFKVKIERGFACKCFTMMLLLYFTTCSYDLILCAAAMPIIMMI